ncbi:uncharacterized protein LY89DRAFT_790381 [Mollisia scopiformis]|uniref:SnoaL-like domain-containing protein n=1 Tax=Mollisia scopiformis TaxID=149040 RepID=A0A132B327_MOLSC|nr:uncharacterized protein LY89DRAFT_790381 [Mollisia scopiformis]KUJ06741.1 hypothetical protein LY89DRAFT_790381 [Mollisia scopiformis]
MAKSKTSEEVSVLAAIQSFSDAIKENSAESLRSLTLSSGSCTRTGINPSSHVNISQAELVGYISDAAKYGDIEGRFDPDEALVKVDGDLAMVWTAWTSFKAGEMTHKGRIVFVLAKSKDDGKWLIVSMPITWSPFE